MSDSSNVGFSAKFNTRVLTYSAICIAVATVLHLVPPYGMGQGGSFTYFSMFFITLIGYFFGPVVGIVGGVAFGLLQLAIKPEFYHPVQVLLDYPVAFGLLGCSGFFRNQKYGLYTGYVVGCLLRFLSHAVSGYIFFGAYAPEGSNLVLYTLGYNASYIAPEMVLTLVILLIPGIRNAIKMIKTKIA